MQYDVRVYLHATPFTPTTTAFSAHIFTKHMGIKCFQHYTHIPHAEFRQNRAITVENRADIHLHPKYDFQWANVHQIHNRVIHFCGYILYQAASRPEE